MAREGEPMSRREFIGAAAAASVAATQGPDRRRRPNMVVIVADDMGYSDPGCYGGDVHTPNLDALAAGGLRFTQCCSTARCWPSRSCLLTGYYAQQVRMDPPGEPLPKWARVIPHYLRPAGYRCYHSGKWHLMGAPKVVADGGFHRSYVLHDHDRFFDPKNHMLDDRSLRPVGPDEGYYAPIAIANHAVGFLREHQEQHGDEPFCLYLAFTSPHFPLHALQEDIDRYRETYLRGWDVMRTARWRRMRSMGLVNCELPKLERNVIPSWNRTPKELSDLVGEGEAPYAVPWTELDRKQQEFQALKMAIHAAMVDRMDQEIGRVLDQVRAMGAWDDTATFFVSDNGASAEQMIRGDEHDKSRAPGSRGTFLCLGPGWSSAANTPFRLHKSWVHEGGISSPLIMHWPRGIADRGELRHSPCHFVDILPTMTDMAGARPEPTWNGLTPPAPPGRSLMPAVRSHAAVPRGPLYFHHEGHRALRDEPWKLVSVKGGPWELYNLRTDRSEQHDLSAKHPDRVAAMAALWQTMEDTHRAQAKTG